MKLTVATLLLAAVNCAAFTLPPTQNNHAASSIRSSRQKINNLAMIGATELGKPGTAELDVPWEELGFEFRPTNSHVRITYKNGEWGAPELVKVCRNNLIFGLPHYEFF